MAMKERGLKLNQMIKFSFSVANSTNWLIQFFDLLYIFCHPPSFCREMQIHFEIRLEVEKVSFSLLQYICLLARNISAASRQQCSKLQPVS